MRIKSIIQVLVLLIFSSFFIAGCTSHAPIVVSNNPDSTGGQGQTIISGENANTDVSSLVTIKDFSFIPQSLKISKGTKVRWVNQDSVAHTIKSDSFSSGELGKGGFFEFTFENTGTYDYICGIHTSMKGTIIVE